MIGSSEQKWFSKAGYTISGLFFYMGAWNHVVFLPTVVSIIIVYCVVYRVEIKKTLTAFPWFIFGGLIGVIPKLYGVIVHGYSFIPPRSTKEIPALSNTLLNLIYTLGGDSLYAKICGEILFSFNWFLPLWFIPFLLALSLPVSVKWLKDLHRSCNNIYKFIFDWFKLFLQFFTGRRHPKR